MTGPIPRNRIWRRSIRCALVALVWQLLCAPAQTQTEPGEDVNQAPISVTADIAHQWRSADGRAISVLRGHCRVQQGNDVVQARQMVLWQSTVQELTRLELYAEDDVKISRPASTRSAPTLFTELWSRDGASAKFRWTRKYDQPMVDPMFQRATARRRRAGGAEIRRTQGLAIPPPLGFEFSSNRIEHSDGPVRRFRLYARTGQPFSFESEQSNNSTPPEQILIVTGGVKLNLDSIRPDGTPDPKAIELAADNIVIWTQASDLASFSEGGENLQARDTPFQVYLEGNIVIRQQGNELYAGRAFYDARENIALLDDAELRMWVESAGNWLRVRAQTIRQTAEKSFHARNAWMTASTQGRPGYRLESSDIFLEPRVVNPWVHQQGGWIDPVTGKVDDGKINWVTTLNNQFRIGEVPFFYTPYLSGPAEDPHLPIQRAAFKSDNILGTQVRTAWNPYHLFAKDAPEELSASLLIDYFSRRGPAAGAEGAYDGEDLFGMRDRYSGEFHGWYINDGSEDNLGLDRRKLSPRDENRGRFLWRHKHDLPWNTTVITEAGYVSDRNLLEQYYENEFDQEKDNETRLIFEQRIQNLTGSLMVQPQVNGFENRTEWYPKGDLTLLGEPVFGSPFLWSTHTSAGYARLQPADGPTDIRDTFTALPWYAGVDGEVLMSRHELAVPFNLGPIVLNPYVRGEAAYWGNDLMGVSRDRLVGTAGLRGSLTMWKLFPHVHSAIFNLHGLAHKMVFDFDWSWTDATEEVGMLAQYNAFDDDAQERFRQRFITNTFMGAVPTFLNPRLYAIRSGAGSMVSAPWHELVGDLHVVRLGWRHRLQTKVGPPGDMRTRDWMTLDLEASFFPREQENFGDDFGLLSARYSLLLSDRTTLLANALYDTFGGGQQLWNVGVMSQRSARGSTYLGVRQIKARGLDSQILTGSVSYLMNPKWVTTGSTAYDLAEGQNRGQSFTLTRIGRDFLFHAGMSFDRSKDNIGVAIALEPVFGPRTPYSSQMNSLLGLDEF